MDATIIDVSNVCHKHWHATGGWAKAGNKEQTCLHGFLRDLSSFHGLNREATLAFCFDSRTSLRKELSPRYKEGRSPTPPKLLSEIESLLTDVLPELGYKNTFQMDGAEADDLIAFLVEGKAAGDRYIIVSNDSDLFQLLRKEVKLYNHSKKKSFNHKDILDNFDVRPKEWPTYKAIMGCSTDRIDGVKGAGPIGTANYIRGRLPTGSLLARIQKSSYLIEKNLELVRLPFGGLTDPQYTLREGRPDTARWQSVMLRHNLPQLLGRCP